MFFARRSRRSQPQTALEQIEAAEHPLVCLSWKGSPCMVRLRELSDIEIQALGNFSLIETEAYKWSRNQIKTPWSDLLSYASQNLKICRAALISPTYDEIFETIGKTAFHIEVKAQVEHVNKMLEEMDHGPARQELESIRDSLILAWDVILPEDFIAGIIAYSLGIMKTDIKKVTEEMLYSAAVLAERGHVTPHEYIRGVFSAFNIRDIDLQAWVIYEEKLAEQREESKYRRDA
jgi:hypothetical protein